MAILVKYIHKIWISKSHQSKYFKTYVTISADQIRQAHAEGLITDDMLTNVWCPTLKQQVEQKLLAIRILRLDLW